MTALVEAMLLLAKSKAAKPAARPWLFTFVASRLTFWSVAGSMAGLANFMRLFFFWDLNELNSSQLSFCANKHALD